MWTGEHIRDEMKTTYGYVLDLRDGLEKTLQVASENLSQAKRIQKRYYDRGNKNRQLEIGDLDLTSYHGKQATNAVERAV